MKCRRLKSDNNRNNVVFFGSYGLNADGTAKFFNPQDKHDNYGTKTIAIADSLVQRLSIIRSELWYAVNYGLPLLANINSKAIMDASVVEIIMQHPDVQDIISFVSDFSQHHYTADMIIQSVYGNITMQI